MDEIQAAKWNCRIAQNVSKRWFLSAIDVGQSMGWKAIRFWSEPTMSVQHVRARRFFPLDQKLRLREDHWSEGAARVAVRQGLQAKSFDLAASAYEDAVGAGMSSDSLRRMTESWGASVEGRRKAEAQQVYAEQDPLAAEKVVAVETPIQTQANVSSDGGMMLLRKEGWKEVKLCVFSEVKVSAVPPTLQEPRPAPKITLQKHSYQAGLWDADEMGQHQYLEGTRRKVALCPRFGSVNDGALWIDRITTTNFSQAIQVIDWGHASERLWKVSTPATCPVNCTGCAGGARAAAFGEGTRESKAWAK
jgi:hypothetical protein